jgi:CDP-paratose 2-epimerase
MSEQPFSSSYEPDFNQKTLIIGGAGFIGSRLAQRLLSEKKSVIVFDNFSRPGVEKNCQQLKEAHGELLEVVTGDVREPEALHEVVQKAAQVFDFASQSTVVPKAADPLEDFATNSRGTLNLLEAIRTANHPVSLVYASTTQVYGHLDNISLREHDLRYEPSSEPGLSQGFSESQEIDFQSPLGCPKAAAEQCVLDYAQTFNLSAVVLRMSCVYGPFESVEESDGGITHFLERALAEEPIIIHGDGHEVKDILHIDDLVEALVLTAHHLPELSGNVFNIGGGPRNTVSLLELLEFIAARTGKRPRVEFMPWTPPEQRYYVSDIRRFSSATGWMPKVSVAEGILGLIRNNQEMSASSNRGSGGKRLLNAQVYEPELLTK